MMERVITAIACGVMTAFVCLVAGAILYVYRKIMKQ